jgi:hypothetical protein
MIGTADENPTGPMSPSDQTTGTTPETPSSYHADDDLSVGSSTTSMLSRIAALTKNLSQQSLKEEDDEDDDATVAPEPMQQLQFVNTPTLRHRIQMAADFDEDFDEDMIPEEVDADAPSDEEDSFQRVMENFDGVHDWEMEPGPLIISNKNTASRGQSPPRPQSHIKLRNAKSTKPGSIVYRNAPSVMSKSAETKSRRPSPGAVDPHTVAHFNKLKIQVKLAKHQEKISRRAAKFEDRYEDVLKYRNLHKEFENIQDKVKTTRKTRLKRSRSFDLSDTNTWFFDFEKLEDENAEDDNVSVSSMSLLSVASMKSQKRFYEEKFQARRRNSEPGISTTFFPNYDTTSTKSIVNLMKASQSETVEVHKKKEKKKPAENPEKKKTMEADGVQSLEPTRDKKKALKSSSILKLIKKENKLIAGTRTSEEETTGSVVSPMTQTNDKHDTPWPLQADSVEIDYHLEKKAPGIRRRDSGEVTDYARNGGFIANSQKVENDYHVPRRRRQSSTPPTSLFIPRPQSPNGSVKSIGSSVSGLSCTGIYTANAEPSSLISLPTYRDFSKEKVVMANADKCIKELNVMSRDSKVSEKNIPNNKVAPWKYPVPSDSNEVAAPGAFTGNATSRQPKATEEIKNVTQKAPNGCIDTMSTQEFLRIAAEEHTLARRYEAAADHVIQAKRLDFVSQADVALEEVHSPSVKQGNQVVDAVSQQVDALLARLRDNSDEPGEEKL